ncbi:MAG: hypothetical protein AAGD07_21005 [Planctomycetota bacterium]
MSDFTQRPLQPLADWTVASWQSHKLVPLLVCPPDYKLKTWFFLRYAAAIRQRLTTNTPIEFSLLSGSHATPADVLSRRWTSWQLRKIFGDSNVRLRRSLTVPRTVTANRLQVVIASEGLPDREALRTLKLEPELTHLPQTA